MRGDDQFLESVQAPDNHRVNLSPSGRGQQFLPLLAERGAGAYVFDLGGYGPAAFARVVAHGGHLHGQGLSFSDDNDKQQALVLLPAYGWIHSATGTRYVIPKEGRPSQAILMQKRRDV